MKIDVLKMKKGSKLKKLNTERLSPEKRILVPDEFICTDRSRDDKKVEGWVDSD